ncbi:unnamed protein product [Durusdinium trenchii]|uniref:Calpain catalytic domain-containing protein n=1 Tax=Durusdinium trenchii TaxID=1381693 RepID=A0ABP0MIL3_9DINO
MCHVGQGKKCRKHLSPFTKQIRVEDEAEETEEEADPDLSFHQVFRAARRFVLGDFDGSEFSLEKTLEKAAQMERQQRRSAGFKYIVIPENPEFNESFQRSACKRLSSEAVLFKKRPQASDVAQGGEAHNCGFMAALAAIADHQDGYLVRLLLEEEDDLKLVRNLNQCGCYRVSLFLNTSSRNLQKYRQAHPSLIASEKEVFFSNTRNSIKAEARGSWRTIVVDDIVPDSDGPRACRPKGAVDLTDALVILTGQSTFRIELARLNSAARKKLFKDLCEYKQRGLLVTAGILQNEAQVLPNGLVTRHAYTLLDFIPLLDHTKRHR